MRVHELSKELNLENKEVIAFLEKRGVEIGNHMSTVSPEDADAVRAAYKKKEKPEAKEAPANKKREETAAPAKKSAPEQKKPAEEEPKKKKLIRVIRPQNAQHGVAGNTQGNNRQGRGSQNKGAYRKDGLNNRPRNNDRLQGSHDNRPAAPDQERIRVADRRLEGHRDGLRPSERATQRREAAERAEMQRLEEQARREQEAREAEARAREEAARLAQQEAKQAREAEESHIRKEASAAAKDTDRRGKNDRPGTDRQGKAERQNKGERPVRGERTSDRSARSERPARADRPGTDRPVKSERTEHSANDRSGRDGRPGRSGKPENSNASKQSGQDPYKKRKGRKDQRPYEEEFDRKGSTKKAGAFQKPQKVERVKEEEVIKMITVPETITIQSLADKMKVQPSAIVKKLFMKGTIVTINQEVAYETAEEIAMDYDILCEPEKKVDLVEEMLREEADDESKLVSRPPVVCVMGHVDHGKTSLLDAIRNTSVTAREAGGITQHIGAYTVNINGQNITFLDTPGHEAFTSMRMRGANSTDIAILVVAADDGIMPQTVEAINHAKAAGVEIIVAINKMDKPGANADRVKQELTEYELIPEDWGGSTVCVPVSAKTHEGIEDLLEMIVLTADVMELKADPNRTARGLVLEAKLDKGKGPVATVLVQKGTLHVGDPVAAGPAYGRVRAMMDDKGHRVKEAGPSTPVEILGLNDVPGAGDVFVGPETEKDARNFAETYISQQKVSMLSENKSKLKMSLDDLYAQIKEGNLKELPIIVKADVQGSVEAVRQSLEKLSNDEVTVKVIHGAVGAINESDVTLASASNAIIIGFNVRPDSSAKDSAEQEGVDIRLYRVIYNAIEDVEAAMKGMLDPEFKEEVIGHAEVRQTFRASGIGTIAGSYVQDGRIEKSAGVRLIRDSIVIYEGSLASLRRVKDDVKEVRAGYECGMVLENYQDIKEGDQIEAFVMVEVPR